MTKNAGTFDRIVRIILGIGLITWAAAFSGPAWAWIGILPLATGAMGFCALYSLLGINTCSIKK